MCANGIELKISRENQVIDRWEGGLICAFMLETARDDVHHASRKFCSSRYNPGFYYIVVPGMKGTGIVRIQMFDEG